MTWTFKRLVSLLYIFKYIFLKTFLINLFIVIYCRHCRLRPILISPIMPTVYVNSESCLAKRNLFNLDKSTLKWFKKVFFINLILVVKIFWTYFRQFFFSEISGVTFWPSFFFCFRQWTTDESQSKVSCTDQWLVTSTSAFWPPAKVGPPGIAWRQTMPIPSPMYLGYEF